MLPKHYYTYCFTIICSLLLVTCTSDTEKENAENESDLKTTLSQAPEKKTQAILMTQPFPYDADYKTRITSAYQSVDEVNIPLDLSPQNKWIMFEGPVLENDKIAYRFYADSRHRFDIYGKRVSSLVMDTVSWQYHEIMDWGSDILKVGNSLGIGSPGIWYQDSIYTLSDCQEKTIKIVENGNDRSMIRTTFVGLVIDDQTFDVIQDWSIEKGNYWSEIQLSILGKGLPAGMKFATGVVKHLPQVKTGNFNSYTYVMNWGDQSYHEEKMGMAVLAKSSFAPRLVNEDELTHLMVFDEAENTVTYRFMTAWERDESGVEDADSFMSLLESAMKD